MAFTKICKKNHNTLFSALKSKGFTHIRFVFVASNITNGKKQTFFIEFYFINPSISPKRAVLFSEAKASQGLLPSYCAVRCGTLGRGGKELFKYCTLSEVIFDKKTGNLQMGAFTLTDDVLIGSVSEPAGNFDWNLQYEKQIIKAPEASSSKFAWNSDGVKTVVGGVLHFNGEEYQAVPNVSFGYSDFSCGTEFSSPWYHVSACNLVSTINSKQLSNSCFSVQKIGKDKYIVYVKLEGKVFCLKSVFLFRRKAVQCSCIESIDESGSRQLHWSSNLHIGKYVVDIDIYCHESSMYFRDFDHPDGIALSNVLSGGTGVGEVRYYKKNSRTKTLEIVEDARVTDALCEYGNDKKL